MDQPDRIDSLRRITEPLAIHLQGKSLDSWESKIEEYQCHLREIESTSECSLYENIEKTDVIVLTGALRVIKDNHAIKDKNERLLQYIHSLLLYPTTRIKDIVFCENSGWDYNWKPLIDMARSFKSNLEILLFEEKGTKNYGLLEHRIIKFILNNSQLLIPHEYFYKVTGRLFIQNLDDILEKHKHDDCVFFKRNQAELDVRFFKISKTMFLKQLAHEDELYEKHIVEKVFHKKIERFTTFSELPVFVGRSGRSGKIYNIDYHPKVMEEAKRVSKSIVPQQ